MFENKKFDVENALVMHAESFSLLPANGIYDEAALKPLMSIIERCHIYFVGLVPKADFVDARQSGRTLTLSLDMLGKTYDASWALPDGFDLKKENGLHYVLGENGTRSFPAEEEVFRKLGLTDAPLNFDVQYIGQAYGSEGSRNALERLKKHETLQKISLRGIPDGYGLQLLLLEVAPSTQLITMFNPRAQDKTQGRSRITAGLDKLFGTTAKERVSLFEAAFIRYFRPSYNDKFKDSFPSTNMKLLNECYGKDFSAVIAEISIDELTYKLFSKGVPPRHSHIANHSLHTEDERKVFFSEVG